MDSKNTQIVFVLAFVAASYLQAVNGLSNSLRIKKLIKLEDDTLAFETVELENSKRSNDFYEDPENIGYYAYHGKNYKRSNDFYEDPENIGYYAYHGKNYKRSTVPKPREFQNISNCRFQSKDSVFSCQSNLIRENPVHCEASLHQSDLSQFNFTMFGIEINTGKTSATRFNLYPFIMSNDTNERVFYNYQIRVNEKNIDLALFHSSVIGRPGINVKDAICFRKIVNLLEKSSKLKTVDFNISSDSTLTQIKFIGDIFVDKFPPKLVYGLKN